MSLADINIGKRTICLAAKYSVNSSPKTVLGALLCCLMKHTLSLIGDERSLKMAGNARRAVYSFFVESVLYEGRS